MNRIVVFESVHQAIRCEKLLQKTGIVFEMTPTPREISASCGQSLAFDAADLSRLREFIEQSSVLYKGIFTVDAQRHIYELVLQGRTR